MPEGDTIYRTAAAMHRWIGGRRITAARTTTGAPVGRLVGETIEDVEARAKHLLIHCTGNLTVHTHMKMTGSWHVYGAEDRWRRPGREARLVIECGDRLAVCFNAPVIELIERRAEQLHPALAGLGPDVLRPPVDLDEIRRRAAMQPPTRAVGDVLLDQTIVSGIGNIWRAETLFVERMHPATPIGSVTAEQLDALVSTASRLVLASATSAGGPGMGRPREPYVYRRRGRPCRRCRTPIASARFENGRSVYWCPSCQRGPTLPNP